MSSKQPRGGLHLVVTRNVQSLMPHRGIRLQKELANKLGWGPDKVSRKFNDGWQLDDLEEVAAALNVEVRDLLLPGDKWVPGTGPIGTPTGEYLAVSLFEVDIAGSANEGSIDGTPALFAPAALSDFHSIPLAA